MSEQPQQRFTALGKLVSILLVAGLIALGVYMIRGNDTPSGGEGAAAPQEGSDSPAVSEVQVEVPKLSAAGAGADQGQHRTDRDQRVCGVRGADCSERRPGADRELGVLQEPWLQGPPHGQRGRKLVGVERRKACRLGDDRRRAGGIRATAPRDRPRADWVLTRRRWPRREERHHAHQRAQGQDDCDRAVHRGRLLHPLPRAGSRSGGQRAWKSRQRPASRTRERGVHGGWVRRRRSVPVGCEVGKKPAGRLCDVGAEGVGGRPGQRWEGACAHDESQPADRGRRADRPSRLRGAAAENRRGTRARADGREPDGSRSSRTHISTSSAGRSNGPATRHATS